MDESLAIEQVQKDNRKGKLKTILWIITVIALLLIIYFLWNPFAPNVYGEGLKIIVP